jgi:hypothetical protein
MKRVAIFAAIFWGGMLCSEENLPLSFEVGAGYGQEHCRWKSCSDTSPSNEDFRQSYHKIQLAEVYGALRSVQYDFYFLLEGEYGYPFSPRLDEFLLFDGEDVYLTCRSRGYSAHSLFLFGYQVDLTPDRFTHFFVAPLAGYVGYWKKLQQKKREEATFPNLTISQELDTLKQTWYGPCLGGGLFFQPDPFWRFELSYLFDWLDLRHSSHLAYDYWTPLHQGFVSQREKEKKLSAYGHLARATLFYHISPKWKTLLQADYHYFASNNHRIVKRTKTEQNFPVEETSFANDNDRIFATEWQLSFLLEIALAF